MGKEILAVKREILFKREHFKDSSQEISGIIWI